nr:hypothetical protein [Variovorax boronicumulans]
MGPEPVLQALIFGGLLGFAVVGMLLMFKRTRRFSKIALPLSISLAAIPPVLMLPFDYAWHFLVWYLVFSLPATAISCVAACAFLFIRRHKHALPSSA